MRNNRREGKGWFADRLQSIEVAMFKGLSRGSAHEARRLADLHCAVNKLRCMIHLARTFGAAADDRFLQFLYQLGRGALSGATPLSAIDRLHEIRLDNLVEQARSRGLKVVITFHPVGPRAASRLRVQMILTGQQPVSVPLGSALKQLTDRSESLIPSRVSSTTVRRITTGAAVSRLGTLRRVAIERGYRFNIALVEADGRTNFASEAALTRYRDGLSSLIRC